MKQYLKEQNGIIALLLRVWDFLKKTIVGIFNFLKNLVNWFKSRYDRVLKNKPNSKAISVIIRDNIENERYNSMDIGLSKKKTIANTFYDEDTGEILTEDTEVILYDSLDEKTKEAFGDKEMLVLE